MKIGIDVRLWNETGVGRYIRNLITELAQIDTKNTYVLFVKKEDYGTIKKNTPDGWKIVPISIQWHSVKEQLSFLPILYKENLDLMHFPYFSLPVLYRRPFVVTIHDLIIHSFSTGKASTLPLPLYKLKHFAYKKVIEHATKQAKKVIVPLDSVKKEVEKTLYIPPRKVVVTHEGFDKKITLDSNDKPQDSRLDNYFLYVGNTYPHKNVQKLFLEFLFFHK
jgi:glycosyltransferase involved in cell wall biosynthesis